MRAAIAGTRHALAITAALLLVACLLKRRRFTIWRTTPLTARILDPRRPDMRLARTHDLSDGALFYIIENEVRLTGMPA